MKTAVLAGINARYSHSCLALLYLKAAARDSGFEMPVMEFSINRGAAEIADQIASAEPDAVALSVYIWNSTVVREVIPLVRQLVPGAAIVLGGPEVSYSPEMWLGMLPERGFVICGPGEDAFRELAVAGFESGEKIIRGKDSDFDRVLFPYSTEEMERLKGKILYYESSRGCPFRCSYCLSSRNDIRLQFRDMSMVKNELDFLCSFRPGLVKFVDRTFNIGKHRYREIWDHLASHHGDKDTVFHFEIFPELLDDDDLDFLCRVPQGLFQFEMGIQSACTEALEAVNRKSDLERAFDRIERLAAAGNIHLHADLIAGLPFEDYSSLRRSFDRLYSLPAEHFQAGFLKVLPGTEMSERSGEYGIVSSPVPPYEIVKNRWLSEEEMNRARRISRLTDFYRNQGRFPSALPLAEKLYGSPFSLYERLAELFSFRDDASHRKWIYGAEILIQAVEKDHPGSLPLLADHLRWDWCLTAKSHHYPELLRSGLTREAKRKGYNFFITRSVKNRISFGGETVRKDELRRGIFFMPETDEFRRTMMDGDMALFLPGRRRIFFDLP